MYTLYCTYTCTTSRENANSYICIAPLRNCHRSIHVTTRSERHARTLAATSHTSRTDTAHRRSNEGNRSRDEVTLFSDASLTLHRVKSTTYSYYDSVLSRGKMRISISWASKVENSSATGTSSYDSVVRTKEKLQVEFVKTNRWDITIKWANERKTFE